MYHVIVEVKHTKSHPPLKLAQSFPSWKEADEVYEHFLKLYKLGNNVVFHVAFQEDNEHGNSPRYDE